MRKLRFRKLIIFFSVFTVISYLSVFVSPATFWPIGWFNYLIPVLIFMQIILVIILAVRRKKIAWVPFITLLVGWSFVDHTFNLPKSNSIENHDFEVLSFNTRYFRERRDYSKFHSKTISWAVSEPSAIKCFQEYSTNPDIPEIDITNRMKAAGYDSYTVDFVIEDSYNYPGLAIFSKYPIVSKGLILLNENSINNCIFADLKIGKDTLRVYNFHLKSMGLRLSELKQRDKFSKTSQETVTKLGSASSKRALELNRIIDHIEECPYPYILTCDFNELIYGNNYYKIKQTAQDTFEEEGSGFGFTFNSILFFIRIDHQFFSDGLEALDFEVLRDVKSSDHFPLKGWYRLEED